MNVSLYEISADFLKALDGLEVDEETGEPEFTMVWMRKAAQR